MRGMLQTHFLDGFKLLKALRRDRRPGHVVLHGDSNDQGVTDLFSNKRPGKNEVIAIVTVNLDGAETSQLFSFSLEMTATVTCHE